MSLLEDRRRRISDLVGEEPVVVKKVGRPRKDGTTDPRPPKIKRPPGRPRKDGTTGPRSMPEPKVKIAPVKPVVEDEVPEEGGTLSSTGRSGRMLRQQGHRPGSRGRQGRSVSRSEACSRHLA